MLGTVQFTDTKLTICLINFMEWADFFDFFKKLYECILTNTSAM